MKKPPTEGASANEIASIKERLYDQGEELTGWEEEALPHLTLVLGSEGGSRKAEFAKAALQVHLSRVLERAIDRLVASSDSNTRTMSRLTRAYVALTVVIALATVAGVWVSYRSSRTPAQIIVPAPMVHVHPVVGTAPIPAMDANKPTERPKPKGH